MAGASQQRVGGAAGGTAGGATGETTTGPVYDPAVRFQGVFIAVMLGTSLVVAAFLVHRARPERDRARPTAAHVTATGECALCHRRETSAVVHEYETSRHAGAGVSCLDCHQPATGQGSLAHNGYTIAPRLTAANCARCHATEYEQFLRSRHAAPAYAAVLGAEPFTAAQRAHAERYHPAAVERPANALAKAQAGATLVGCLGCHKIGEPHPDGSIGRCTECHSRHASSVALARTPSTCGQCHMGPDHSQIEIYEESKHGALFEAQRAAMRLDAPPKSLSTADMPVPTCATCHLSGLDGLEVTHDVGQRLSWYLFAPVSEKRREYQGGRDRMQAVCKKCHAATSVDRFWEDAERVVAATNAKVAAALAVVAALRAEGRLTPEPFDEAIEFVEFDLWHYYGRTAKHGAFMGGADFVQWHGNYELLQLAVKLEELAATVRAGGR